MKFINSEAALLCANAAFLLILIAVSYYSFRKLAQVLRHYTGSKQLAPTIQKLIPFSRSIHVYASVLAGIVATAHAIFFLISYPLSGIKIYSGVVTLFIFSIVALLGLALQHNRPNLQVRYRHRNVAVVFITALLIHRLVS